MFALFDTLEQYLAKNHEINTALGYPDGKGTERYATEVPMLTAIGKYAMQILPHVERFFADCVVVESVEYPEIEVTNETN